MEPFSEIVSNAQVLAKLAGRQAADNLMQSFGSLSALSKASFPELSKIKGVGPKRAEMVQSAFLLSIRLAQERYQEAPLLDSPEKIADVLREPIRQFGVETFQVVLLNTRRRLISVVQVSQGTLDTLLIHPREVFRSAIIARASAVVLAHNHPSGDPTPSEADIKITRDLIRAGQIMKIDVLDHIILGQATIEKPRDYVSLLELGFFS